MSEALHTDVIIIGGGPVGLSAAMDLARRNIRTVLIERRAFKEAPNVKCNHVSARTMERFRQLGIADAIRHGGFSADYPHDIVFATSFTGKELSRVRIPSVTERRSGTVSGPDTAWNTPEPAHRINQHYMEPILMEAAAERPQITFLTETEFVSMDQDEQSVTATVTLASGETQTVTAPYAIGADGGRSSVRKIIGAKLEGDAVLQEVQSTYIRAPRLYDVSTVDPAWGYYTFNHRRSGHVYAIDGQETFLVHNHLAVNESADTVDRDEAIRGILGVDTDFEYEILSKEDWVARRLVANTFRDRRVFIAGDAAHLWVPYAGYGMNAGIADVLNLTWLLGGVLAGWANPRILEAYEAERKPVTEQVSRHVMAHQRKVAREDVPEQIEAEGPEADQVRATFGEFVYDLNVQQFAAAGLNFGYVYDASPIVVHEDVAPPALAMGTYEASSAPGARVPHFWLEPNVSLYDRLGTGYTLIAFAPTDGLKPLLDAFAEARIPLETLTVPAERKPTAYETDFVICRDDQHVVWRGNESPQSPGDVISTLRGDRI